MKKQTAKIFLIGLLFSSVGIYAQIQEERLILDKKREPEVQKIEKKKTSVETLKNYPPEEKSSVPVKYSITNVPAVSDFKTSVIQGQDVSPTLNQSKTDNYFRIGYGNFGKILADANISTVVDNKLEIGADAHFLSTDGLKKEYAWDSKASEAQVAAYLNSYGEQGKFNLTAQYDLNKYNYYGIYALEPEASIDLEQKTNRFTAMGYYDFYSNEILNDFSVKASFLGDHFDAKENSVEADLNLSKHDVPLPLDGFTMSADLGVGLDYVDSNFKLLNANESQYVQGELSPKLTFRKGDSYLMIGSDFSFFSSTVSSLSSPSKEKVNKTYWFPRAELLLSASKEFNFYAGIDGGLKFNSYGSLLEINPYLVSDQVLKPTREKYRFYFGIKGDLDENLKYDLSGGYAKVENIQYFYNNGLFDLNHTLNRSAYNFANVFSSTYGDGNISHVNAKVEYFPLANLTLMGQLNYENYSMDSGNDIYYKPQVTGVIGAKYAMLDKKLHLGFQGIFASKQYTNSWNISTVENPDVPGTYLYSQTLNPKQQIDGYMDLNLSAEYKFHKNFSIFALGNNLLSDNYEQHLGYKVLGAQIVGGLKITF